MQSDRTLTRGYIANTLSQSFDTIKKSKIIEVGGQKVGTS